MQRSSRMSSFELIALVASIMALTALAIDIMLPAFDAVRESLGLDPNSTETAKIVTFFFLGQAAQIIHGPLSDRFGRLPIMRLGFALYIIGCFGAALLPSLSGILAARFVVGVGAAAMQVCAVATIRDRFEGDRMARTMSLILTIFLIVPMIAPLLGTAILSLTSSWQVVFLLPPIGAVIIFFWSLRLDESLVPERRRPLDVATLTGSARRVIGNVAFVRYTLITTILFGVFSSYIASSERIIGEIYGRPDLFVVLFSGVALTLAIFTFLNSRLVGRFGARRAVRGMLTVYWLLASSLLGLTLIGQADPPILVFFIFLALIQGLNVGAEPNSSALALEPLGDMAGMAAAIYGTLMSTVGAFIGSSIDRLLVDSIAPLCIAFFIVGGVAVVLVYSDRRAEDAIPQAESVVVAK